MPKALSIFISFFGGLSSFLMQNFASNSEVRDAIAQVLDSQFKSSFPAPCLLQKVVHEHVKYRVCPNPDVPITANEMLDASRDIVARFKGSE